jgi:hypothetical protein
MKRVDLVKKGKQWVAEGSGKAVPRGPIKAEAVKRTARAAKRDAEPVSVKIHKTDVHPRRAHLSAQGRSTTKQGVGRPPRSDGRGGLGVVTGDARLRIRQRKETLSRVPVEPLSTPAGVAAWSLPSRLARLLRSFGHCA